MRYLSPASDDTLIHDELVLYFHHWIAVAFTQARPTRNTTDIKNSTTTARDTTTLKTTATTTPPTVELTSIVAQANKPSNNTEGEVTNVIKTLDREWERRYPNYTAGVKLGYTAIKKELGEMGLKETNDELFNACKSKKKISGDELSIAEFKEVARCIWMKEKMKKR